MKKPIGACATAILVVFVQGASIAQAEKGGADASVQKTAIEQAGEAYVAAFNARDAKALAALWSPDGVYTSRTSGEEITGRDDLEKDFVSLFAAVKDAKLEIATESIEFVSPNVAVEQGTATVVKPDTPPEKSSYSVVYVKRDGSWLIDRTSEEDDAPAPSNYEQLKALDWMVGNWVDQEGGSVIKTTCRWTRNKNYMVRTFTATIDDHVDLTGMQFVGWDAAKKKIRSWVFDSAGGFSEGTWRRDGDRWIVHTRATLIDGSQGSSTTVLRPIDEGSFGWQKINRVIDGEILPNIDEVIIVRE